MKTPAGAADLRFRVRFDRKVEQSDPGGGTVSDWSTLGTGSFVRWSDIRPMRGGEGIQAQRLTGTQPVLIITRADSNTKAIDADWRAVEMRNGSDVRFYALKTAEDMERGNQFITMIGVAGDPDGGGA